MAVYKKVNKNGSITIPQQLRHDTGIRAGVPLEIETTENSIILKKYVPTCMFCGSAENVAEIQGFCICRNCAEEILRRTGYGSDRN